MRGIRKISSCAACVAFSIVFLDTHRESGMLNIEVNGRERSYNSTRILEPSSFWDSA